LLSEEREETAIFFSRQKFKTFLVFPRQQKERKSSKRNKGWGIMNDRALHPIFPSTTYK